LGGGFPIGLGDVEHRGGFEPDEALGPLLGRCLVVRKVAVLVVARRILALRALGGDDRCPDSRLALLEVVIELLLLCPVALRENITP
jgi:hypothetical protein